MTALVAALRELDPALDPDVLLVRLGMRVARASLPCGGSVAVLADLVIVEERLDGMLLRWAKIEAVAHVALLRRGAHARPRAVKKIVRAIASAA